MTEQPPNSSSDRTWYEEGLAQIDGKQYEAAIASFDRALEIQADDFQICWARGNALYELERTEEAIIDYDRALQLQPDSHQLWLWRGKVLTTIKRHQEALFSYEKALEIQREIGDRRAEVDTLLNLATSYPMNGKIREGFQAQKQAVEIAQELDLTPDDPLYPLASQDLKIPAQLDVLIEKMGWAEKLINFGRQGKFQLSLVLIIWLLYFIFSIAFSPIALGLRFFRQLARRT